MIEVVNENDEPLVVFALSAWADAEVTPGPNRAES